jgi:RNA polymerase sigma factor (sigma-70 family)
MRIMDDRELLKAYARDRSEAAFAELVRRHLAWVYSVALRHTGNQALAKDVAQSVFVLLAEKAGSLSSATVLGGWLFRTTRFVGNRALRAETRRKTREETAASMIASTTMPGECDTVWKQLEPCLDQAVAALSEADRQAILLRFYEKKPLLEIGQQLGMTEEAAKKRVSRAVQKMRDFLVRRGVAVGGTLLAGLMVEHTVQAVPVTLAASVSKAAGLGISSSTALPRLAQETLNAWRWNRLKIAGGVAFSIGALVWVHSVLTPRAPIAATATAQSVQATEEPPAKPVAAAAAPNFPAMAAPVNASNGPTQRIFHFHVVAKDSGEPVTGAPLAVSVRGDEISQDRFDLATDQNGNADVPYPAGPIRLDVGVIASGWSPRFVTWRTDKDPEIPAGYTMRVDRLTNSVGGWLRDEQGQPVANAIVEVEFGTSDMAQQENPHERPGFFSTVPVTKSDQDGRWTCAVLEPNAYYRPMIRIRHADFAPVEIAPGDSELRSGKLITTMTRGVTLAGRILSEDGVPVSGAVIERGALSREPAHAETDTQGGFAIPNLPPGAFDFLVTAPGFAQTFIRTNLKVSMEPMEIRLKPGGGLRIRLVDEQGNAIENGTVVSTGPAGIYMSNNKWEAHSDANGRVEWNSAPTDSMINICASKFPEFAMAQVFFKKLGEGEHEIRLRRVFAVTGRVTDARTGELIKEEIKAFPFYNGLENGWFRGDAWRSTKGTFEVHFNDRPGPWRFSVEADGYAPFVSDWLRADSTNVFDVALQPADAAKP